jgi:hypothetical protein
MQYTQFRAKSEKNDLKPTDFLECNFHFEMEGILGRKVPKLLESYGRLVLYSVIPHDYWQLESKMAHAVG